MWITHDVLLSLAFPCSQPLQAQHVMDRYGEEYYEMT